MDFFESSTEDLQQKQKMPAKQMNGEHSEHHNPVTGINGSCVD